MLFLLVLHFFFCNLLQKISIQKRKHMLFNSYWWTGIFTGNRPSPLNFVKKRVDSTIGVFLWILQYFKAANTRSNLFDQINLIKLISQIFWIKNCSIKFDVYTVQLVWSKLIKLISNKWGHLARSWRTSCLEVFLEISQNSQENTCARVSFLIKFQASGDFLWILRNV